MWYPTWSHTNRGGKAKYAASVKEVHLWLSVMTQGKQCLWREGFRATLSAMFNLFNIIVIRLWGNLINQFVGWAPSEGPCMVWYLFLGADISDTSARGGEETWESRVSLMFGFFCSTMSAGNVKYRFHHSFSLFLTHSIRNITEYLHWVTSDWHSNTYINMIKI